MMNESKLLRWLTITLDHRSQLNFLDFSAKFKIFGSILVSVLWTCISIWTLDAVECA